MRYALIFAGVAAAYDAYGYDSYGENKASSSTPADQYSSAPTPSKPSSSSKLGYTTIYPGYGKQPVTVTSQYQPYPTCGAAGSDGKSCNEWNEDKYVSTVIDDCDSKKVTVTYVEKPITVYHTKTTITHYPTASAPGGNDGKAYPTGSYSYGDKKNSTKVWYEMYEKVHEIKYKDLGAHGLPGYGGSGLCQSCDDEQPYKVKEYKNGKWSEYDTTAVYEVPTPEIKTYEKPGVYTEPAKDVTVTYTMTKPSEATTTAKAGVPVTYGGVTTEFKETGVKTCAYGAYETGKDNSGNDVTSTVVKTITVTVSTTGKYEVTKPTTTVYDNDTEVKYPTVSVYQPGVYHKDAQTVTITKAGETASCEYKQTKTYPSVPKETISSVPVYPASSSTPVYNTEMSSSAPYYPASSSTPVYNTEMSSSTPCASSSSMPPVGTETSSAPYYPASSSTPVYNTEMSSSTPCASSSSMPPVGTETSSAPYYPASSSTPVYNTEMSSSTPCASSSSMPPVGTETSSAPYYPASSSTPVYNTEMSSSAPYYPASSSTPVYNTEMSSSTPCASSSSMPPVGTETSSAPYYPASSSMPPVGTETSSAPYYPASSSTPVYSTEMSSSTPCASSSSMPSVETKTKSEEYPVYPTSTPVYGEEYPPNGGKTSSAPSYPATTTVPHYENGQNTPCPSSTQSVDDHTSSAYPKYPTPTPNQYNGTNGYGYSKRSNIVQRRKATAPF